MTAGSEHERRSAGTKDASPKDAVPGASPFPPLGASLVAGFRSVGASPVILAAAFLSLLATWSIYVVLGPEPGARLMALLMALSPAHVFSDIPVTAGTGSAITALVGVIVLGVIRAVTFGLLTLLTFDAVRSGAPDLRDAVRRLPRVAASLFALYVVEVAAAVVLLQVLVGVLGPFAIAVVVGALYFLLFAPVVAGAERASAREALVRSMRAARLPGPRHLAFVLVYFLLLYYGSSVSPFGPLSPATPTIPIWSFALAATVVHTGFLGALVFRWMAVRDLVPARAPAPKPR
jgi:hypothetical protein